MKKILFLLITLFMISCGRDVFVVDSLGVLGGIGHPDKTTVSCVMCEDQIICDGIMHNTCETYEVDFPFADGGYSFSLYTYSDTGLVFQSKTWMQIKHGVPEIGSYLPYKAFNDKAMLSLHTKKKE